MLIAYNSLRKRVVGKAPMTRSKKGSIRREKRNPYLFGNLERCEDGIRLIQQFFVA